MSYGGFHPYPRRFGGSRSDLEAMHNSLANQRGTAVDANTVENTAWLETMAFARALVFDGWGTNKRLSHQWDPRRMTDMLSRWEAILALRPSPSDTGVARRARVLQRFARFGGVANTSRLTSELTENLGDVFVAVEHLTVAAASVYVPSASYPWGVVGTPDGDWSSTVAHVLILLQKPDGWSETEFYEAATQAAEIADAILPAWVSFAWYRAPLSTPIAVSGGPSQAGFYLDDEHNLDNNIFD